MFLQFQRGSNYAMSWFSATIYQTLLNTRQHVQEELEESRPMMTVTTETAAESEE